MHKTMYASCQTTIEASQEPSSVPSIIVSAPRVKPGWHLLNNQHILFCGDIASPEFVESTPQAALALAVSFGNWQYNWLLSKAKVVIMLKQSPLDIRVTEEILKMFSRHGEIIIFPGLPSWKLLAIAHRLKRNIYAGESNIKRCNEIVEKLRIKVERLSP